MIHKLAKKIPLKKQDLDQWYQNHISNLQGTMIPVYSSVDLRNSGFKISVVDTNLFPAGFNNLCETFAEKTSQEFKSYLQKNHPSVQKILIFPEEHTRNLYYWKNIYSLQSILQRAGFKIQVGSASTLLTYPFDIDLRGDKIVTVKKALLKDSFLQTDDFIPDAILINNDLSTGTPDYLMDLHQLLIPSPYMGWHRRKKSIHFSFYQKLIGEISQILDIDPWFLLPLSKLETGIDLTDEICLKQLQESADQLLSLIRQKYLYYGIQREPYLFVKNNSGTYGLGITHIDSGRRFIEMNRKTRNKLESAKGGYKVSEYLLQEGLPTADFHKGRPIEPVVYLVGGEAVGTFFRVHDQKNELENLNTPGMSFTCLCSHKVESLDHLFLVTAFLGRVASLAAALELKETHQVPSIKSA